MQPKTNVFHGHEDTTLIGHPGSSTDVNAYVGPAPEFRTTLRFAPSPDDVEILANGGDLMVTVITYGAPFPPVAVWALRGMQNTSDSLVDRRSAKIINEIAQTNFAEEETGGPIGD